MGVYDFSDVTGRKVKRVELSPDKEKFTIYFHEGPPRAYGVEGDCCSRSWIEHLEAPPNIDGANLLRVDDSESEDKTEDDALNPVVNPPDGYGSREHECLKVYWTRFRTDRGDITLEYRNSSNGYYGGSLCDAVADEAAN